MDRLTITGAGDAAGSYEMPNNFTFREMHLVKRITELRAGEIYPALQAGDTDVVAAFAIIAVRRAKPWLDAEKLILDSNIDTIEIIGDEEEEEGPPVASDDAEDAVVEK